MSKRFPRKQQSAKHNESQRNWIRKYPERRLLATARSRAGAQNVTITEEWLRARLAYGRCEATGIPFVCSEPGTRGKGNANPWAPSLDRIDPTKPYTQDNTQVVVWAYNMARSAWGDEVVFRIAEALTREVARPVKTRIHVNQHRIKRNRKLNERAPVLTAKTSKDNRYGHEVVVNGPCRVVYRPDKPLSCGATVWVETESEVIVVDFNDEPQGGENG